MTPRFEAIGMVVSDMVRTIGFYSRLGLEFPDGAESEQHVEAPLPGGLRFMLDAEDVIRSIDPEWRRPAGSSIALAFACDSAADVDRVHRELVEAGYESHKEPWDAFWGQRYAVVLDHDGNGVDLYAVS